jgi:hypothetical protein
VTVLSFDLVRTRGFNHQLALFTRHLAVLRVERALSTPRHWTTPSLTRHVGIYHHVNIIFGPSVFLFTSSRTGARTVRASLLTRRIRAPPGSHALRRGRRVSAKDLFAWAHQPTAGNQTSWTAGSIARKSIFAGHRMRQSVTASECSRRGSSRQAQLAGRPTRPLPDC